MAEDDDYRQLAEAQQREQQLRDLAIDIRARASWLRGALLDGWQEHAPGGTSAVAESRLIELEVLAGDLAREVGLPEETRETQEKDGERWRSRASIRCRMVRGGA